MGFFYTKGSATKKQSKHAVGPRKAPETSQNAVTLQRLGCKACPLNNAPVKSPKMKPTIPDETIVYFIGQAPGKDEDKFGKPFIGPSGKLLRQCIPDDLEDYCAFDNVIRDYPPNDRKPTWTEIECCRNKIIKSIEEAKPEMIISFGKVALSWMHNSTDIPGMRGRIFPVKVGDHTCWYMPSYHPSFILRESFNKDEPLKTKFGKCFKLDLEKAFDFLEKSKKAKVVTSTEAKSNIEIFTGEDDEYGPLLTHLKRAIGSKYSAIDVETYPLKPYNKDALLLTISISYFYKDEQCTFAFALEHKSSKWSSSELSKIKKLLCKYLISEKGIKIAHNVPFELEWLMSKLGEDVLNHNVWEDTMMQAHFIDERRGSIGEKSTSYQSLNFLSKIYFGIELKNLFNLNMKNLKDEKLEDILLYNGVDAKYELLLYLKQRNILKENGLLKAFSIAKKRQPTVSMMHRIGIPVNQQELIKINENLNTEIKQIHEDIDKLKVIYRFKKERGKFNPMSNKDVLSVFKDYLQLQEVTVVDKNGKLKYSVDKNILETIDNPLAKLIVKLRNLTKLKSTYVEEFMLDKDTKGTKGKLIYDDGKLHATFNTTFAETGRTSSNGPNMQNFPKRNDKWVRASIVPPDNHIFIAADYGQLEWCTGCCCSRDKVMTEATWNGYDVHMEWAQRIAHDYPKIIGGNKKLKDKAAMKKFRGLVKNKMVFPAMFGAMNETIAEYLRMPIDVVNNIMDDFWDEFYGLREWQKELMSNFYQNGYVEAPNGRRRHYPLTKNQAINYPIQNAAADITCDAMVRLSEYAIDKGIPYLHPILNIHDDLTFCVPDDDKIIEESIETIYKHMINVPFNWVNVPISVEVAIGYNWSEMDAIGKFYSNKDL